MTPDVLTGELGRALRDLQLLDHPFYRRWDAGTLREGELAAYAAQYRHFEAALPATLRGLLAQMPEGSAAELVRRNLEDEEGNPESHVSLFDRFADGVGAAPEAQPTAATTTLLNIYSDLVGGGAATGLAALVAYEMQAPAIAATKSRGLRSHYDLDEAATLFWDIHAGMDADHASWAIEALAALPAGDGEVIGAARSAATAWWAFLDEREAEADQLA